jgi:PAS domain S-box-containing protein
MNPQPENLADMLARLRVLEQENDLLAERAEEISLLGLVAEQGTNEKDPAELLTGVLERVCILKALPYGACLAPRDSLLVVQAAYQVRHAEGARPDSFRLGDPAQWPPKQALVLSPVELAQWFSTMTLAGPAWGPTAAVLVPLKCRDREDACLLFLDDRRSPQELALVLPVLERVADLTQARLDNLTLLARLGRANLHLEEDVAERTKELRRSEARYRTLFDHVPDGVLLVEADNEGRFGHIQNANEVAARMHGYAPEEMEHLNIEDLDASGPGSRLESFESRVWRLQPGDTVQEELLHRRKDGSSFPAEAIGTLVHLQDQRCVLLFLRDITERKVAQLELLRTQRTESVGLLAGGIAHDFNNLLTAIMGQTSIALDLLEPHSDAVAHLGKALEAAEKASVLTKQMLAYSGRGKFTVQPLDFNVLIQENLRILEAALPKQIRFQLDLEPGIPSVLADEGQMQQVIMNLVINGAEAIGSEPGTLSLRTRARHLEVVSPSQWPLCGNALGPGDYVWVEVQDSGVGMGPEVLAQVFEPFFTTKVKGHGLGLSAVQGIVRSHQGALGVDSAPGAGTTFRLLFPASRLETAEVPVEGAPTATTQARKVLVVDDEDYMLEVVRDSLEIFGHQAVLAGSGEAALDWLQQHPTGVDLVLLDLTMPGLGGLETFRRIREGYGHLPVVLSSGFALEETKAQLRGLDLAGFLQKPYAAKELVRLVETLTMERA